jgi:hypothetical protein
VFLGVSVGRSAVNLSNNQPRRIAVVIDANYEIAPRIGVLHNDEPLWILRKGVALLL